MNVIIIVIVMSGLWKNGGGWQKMAEDDQWFIDCQSAANELVALAATNQ